MRRRLSPLALSRHIRQARDEIRNRLAESLSLKHPAALLIDARRERQRAVYETIRRANRDMAVTPGSGLADALRHQSQDFWLVVLAGDGDDLMLWCRRCAANHPDALMVVLSKHTEPGALYSAGADFIASIHGWQRLIAAVAVVAVSRRQALFERRVHERLSERVAREFGPDVARRAGLPPPGGEVMTFHEARSLMLRRALVAARGNHSQAARTLGVSRSTLYRWLEEVNSDS